MSPNKFKDVNTTFLLEYAPVFFVNIEFPMVFDTVSL
jgi:hypothetical protein